MMTPQLATYALEFLGRTTLRGVETDAYNAVTAALKAIIEEAAAKATANQGQDQAAALRDPSKEG